MPNLIVPNEALNDWFTAMLNNDPVLTACRLRLIREAITIDQYTTILELDGAESAFPGYEPRPLLNWSWPIVVDGTAEIEADPVTFTPTSTTDESVFGVYLTSVTGDRLYGAALLEAAVPLEDGADVRCIVTFDLRSIFPGEV